MLSRGLGGLPVTLSYPYPWHPTQSGRDRNSTLKGISGIFVLLTVHWHRSVQLIRNSRKRTTFIVNRDYSVMANPYQRATFVFCEKFQKFNLILYQLEFSKCTMEARTRACISMRHKKGWSHVTLVSHLHSLTSFLPLPTRHFVHACD